MATIEKVSDVYENGKKIGEVYAGRSPGPFSERSETAVEFRHSSIRIFSCEFDDDAGHVSVSAGSVPKLVAALKLWKRRANSFAAYWEHIVMAVGGGLVGYYYVRPHKDKRIEISLGELPGKRELRSRKIPRSVVDKVGDVEIRRGYDITIRGEKVGEIHKLDSHLLAELRRFNVGIGCAQTRFGNIHEDSGSYERLDYGLAGISIRDWEVSDLLELIQLWKKRRGEYPQVSASGSGRGYRG